MSAHPSEQALRDFVDGRLDETSAGSLAEHLEGCEACVERLESFPNDDALVRELRACGEAQHPAAPDLRGRRIAHYELLEELGRGGMGVVYRAFDSRLKRDVALKLILAGEYADAERRARLRQEAEAIAALQHPGIVQVHDVGEVEGMMYLALELLHPGGLAVLTGGHGRSPRWIAALIRQIAETLQYAHSAGVIHRDLKPENLLLAPSGDPRRPWLQLGVSEEPTPPRVKIADFGLCKPLDEDPRLTRAGMMLGTPDYMAPEQAPDSEEPAGEAADIFSLGAILYELLAGTPPFHADSIARQLKRLRDEEPRAPSHVASGIPRELEAICLKCLEKEPTRRYASARELSEDLERFVAGEPVLARPRTPWRELMLWARRKPLFATHLSAAILLYLMHLVEMLALANPYHIGAAHLKLTLLTISWVIVASMIEAVRESPGRRALGESLFALLPMFLIHTEHWVSPGPNLAFIALFTLFIPLAALIRPKPRMLAIGVGATLLSFNAFVAIKHLLRKDLLAIHEILFFNMVLALMGLITYLLMQRLKTGD